MKPNEQYNSTACTLSKPAEQPNKVSDEKSHGCGRSGSERGHPATRRRLEPPQPWGTTSSFSIRRTWRPRVVVARPNCTYNPVILRPALLKGLVSSTELQSWPGDIYPGPQPFNSANPRLALMASLTCGEVKSLKKRQYQIPYTIFIYPTQYTIYYIISTI